MKKGFTLVELMVSLAMLGFILIALTHATVVTMKHNGYIEHKKIALELGQGAIDYLTSLPYNHALLRDIQLNNTFINNSPNTPYGRTDLNNNQQVYLVDDEVLDANGRTFYGGVADINDGGEANNGVDHPNTGIPVAEYNNIAPIQMVRSLTYYKIWGIREGIKVTQRFKEIVMVVYWFELNNPQNVPYHITLRTVKRRQ
jgi:prepilin-type N-terminal cleavage/methylation domain-containing protein